MRTARRMRPISLKCSRPQISVTDPGAQALLSRIIKHSLTAHWAIAGIAESGERHENPDNRADPPYLRGHDVLAAHRCRVRSYVLCPAFHRASDQGDSFSWSSESCS